MSRRRFIPYLVAVAAILVSIAALLTIAREARDWRGDHRGRDAQRHGDRWQQPDNRRDGGRGGPGAEFRGQPGMPGAPRMPGIQPGGPGGPPQGPQGRTPGVPPGAPYLGVNVEPVDGGVAVRSVAPGSPAAAAGVRDGDMIVKAAGQDIRDIEALRAALATAKPGERYDLVVKRDGAEQTLAVVAATAPAQPLPGPPGTPAPPAPERQPRT